MTQEAASFVIWKPKHDGHAPPNWREGMKWAVDLNDGTGFSGFDTLTEAVPWNRSSTYRVPPEALNSPNDDASGDVDAWRRNEAPIDKRKALRGFIQIIKDYPPEMLAEEGITLAPEKDWATELWADVLEAWDMHETAELVRRGAHGAAFVGPINLLRTRFEQMKG